LKSSRNFGDLAAPEGGKPAAGDLLEDLKKKWQRQGITDWDFAGLPERIPVNDRQGRLLGFAWPGLEDDGHAMVNLRLFTSSEECRRRTRKAMLLLYGRHFRNFKGVKKDFTLGKENWALYEGIGSREKIDSDLQIFILEEIFSCREGVIPGQDSFSEKIDAVKSAGLFALGRNLLDKVVAVLRERRAVLDLINRYQGLAKGSSPDRFSEFHEHLDSILPGNFLEVFDARRLGNCPRYLKALLIRIERAHVDPARDRSRTALLTVHAERLASVAGQQTFSPDYEKVLDEYREMVDEYRVSIYAQELKTAFPVSEKRLDKKWRELKALG